MFLMQKATDVTADDLARAYAFGESERPLLRANMVSSIDGAATADGKSAGLASDGDHEIFHLQRAVADAIVVGAHTAVIENYGPPSVEDRYASARAERGQHPVPTLFLVSRSLNLPDDYATVADDDGFQYQLWARVQNGSDTAD